MAALLERWVGPNARRELLGRYPEVGLIIDATGALLQAQEAGVLDRAGLVRAGQVARAFRLALGYLQETDATLPIDVRCGLNIAKRHVRDASFILPWPANLDGEGITVALTSAALEALERFRSYDPLLGVASYPGNLLADIRALANGLAMEVTK